MAHNATACGRVYVIGAGMVGLATAVDLAAHGHAVTLIDPHPASGATYHAGGMLAPAAEVVYRQDPLFPLMQAAARCHDELFDVVSTHSARPLGRRTEGTLVVAADKADAVHLAELADYQSAHGMGVEPVTVRQARKMEAALSPHIAGAVSLPGDTQVFPRMYAEALIDASCNLGTQFVAEAVSRVTDNVIELADGSTIAVGEHDHVVLSNGLGASTVTGWFGNGPHPLKLRPVYGDIVRVKVPRSLDPIITRVVRGFVEDRPVYIIPRVDGTIAIGATSREDEQPEASVGGVYQLLRDAIRLIPTLEECALIEATCGARPGTPDDLPYLGYVSEKIIVSTGYFRHGILLSALGAQVTRQLIGNLPPTIDITACHPLRHATDCRL